ncbi:hypothetical protein G6F46_013264 [Rhizopus delemar]|nr:hypothetical protein G6F46_013264 [Rhizopus delemar]
MAGQAAVGTRRRREVQRRQQGAGLAVGVQVLRPLGAGHVHLHAVQRDLDHAGIARRGLGIQCDAGAFGIGGDARDVGLRAARLAQVGKRFAVNRKVAGGGAVLGRHVRHHASAAGLQRADAWPEEFHELARDLDGAQPLCHGQRQVGGGDARRQRARQAHADHVRYAQQGGHAEHHRLRLQAADAPAQHADAVDHRGVAVAAAGACRGPTPAAAARPTAKA